jgi:DNA helicase-4
MTQFDQYFGFTKTTRLTMTFRFNDRIAAFSSRFVLKNPSQTKKSLRTHATVDHPAVTLHTGEGGMDPIPGILASIAASGPASVFILNRYGFQAGPMVFDDYCQAYRSLRIEAHTAHRSKGLEADYVIVDNLCGGRLGFPSGVADDPVLNLVLAVPDRYEHGEERRLFYVAVTRARKHVHLIARGEEVSPFVREILDDPEYKGSLTGGVTREASRAHGCPVCTRGRMMPAGKGTAGTIYYACANSPICRHAEPACQKCRTGFLSRTGDGLAACDACGKVWHVCPQCGIGVLVPRRVTQDGHKPAVGPSARPIAIK